MKHETREQAALEYLDLQGYTIDEHHQGLRDFIAGASWREHQAASGFEEWLTGRFQVFNNTTLEQEEILYRTAWQASQLSSAKLLAEKDAEIIKLKADNEWQIERNQGSTMAYCAEIAEKDAEIAAWREMHDSLYLAFTESQES